MISGLGRAGVIILRDPRTFYMQSLGGLSVNSQLALQLQLQPIHLIELWPHSRAPVIPHCIYIILDIILFLATEKVLARIESEEKVALSKCLHKLLAEQNSLRNELKKCKKLSLLLQIC